MKKLLSVLVMFLSLPAFADATADLRLTANVSREQMPIQNKIQTALLTEAQKNGLTSLSQFAVDWKSLECHAAKPSEMDPKTLGACFVGASAMQIVSEFVINVTYDGVSVVALYADVE